MIVSKRLATLLTIAFTLLIVGISLWELHWFLSAMLWSGIIAIGSWGLRNKLAKKFSPMVAATLLTGVFVGISLAPLAWGTSFVLTEINSLREWVLQASNAGIAQPAWLDKLPAHHWISQWWATHLEDPTKLQDTFNLAYDKLGDTVTIIAKYAWIGMLSHAMNTLALMLILHGLYLKGDVLATQIEKAGSATIKNWTLYSSVMIGAIKASVNGIVLVSIAEGLILALVYYLFGIPSALEYGLLSGLLAIIPMAMPLLYVGLAGWLYLMGDGGMALGLLVVCTGIMLITENIIRPAIIGNSVKLPFILILFGLIGGLASMGIAGIFIAITSLSVLYAMWEQWQRELSEWVPPDT